MCPFADHNDSRCSDHWTLQNIFQAFTHCADRYSCCPVYRRMLQERLNNGKARAFRAELAVAVVA